MTDCVRQFKVIFDDLHFLMDYIADNPDEGLLLKEITNLCISDSHQYTYADCRNIRSVNLFKYNSNFKSELNTVREKFLDDMNEAACKKTTKYLSAAVKKITVPCRCNARFEYTNYMYKSIWELACDCGDITADDYDYVDYSVVENFW